MLFCKSHADVKVLKQSTDRYYADEAKVDVSNSDAASWVIQAWTESERGLPDRTFDVSPAIFRLDAHQNKTLQVSFKAAPLPQEKESLYWLNVRATPVGEQATSQHHEPPVVTSRIRLIYHPASLQYRKQDVAKDMLIWTQHGQILSLKNPTAYYISFQLMSADGKQLSETRYAAPWATEIVLLPAQLLANKVSWKIVENEQEDADAIYFTF